MINIDRPNSVAILVRLLDESDTYAVTIEDVTGANLYDLTTCQPIRTFHRLEDAEVENTPVGIISTFRTIWANEKAKVMA